MLLLVGAALGTGVARTAVEVADGLTWVTDKPRGEVVQVNPASGRPETRLQVAGENARLEITQKDGVLVVLDRRTGQITVIDLATLLASGRRQAAPGDTSKVLVSEGRIYVVDRAAGTVSNADPVTLVDIGEQWRAGQPLADVVADDDGAVWASDNGGTLYQLEWSDEDSEFVERSREKVRGGGPGVVLVPHSTGVTLFGPDGDVVQYGTGRDVRGSAKGLAGDVLAAMTSPAGLVPVAVPGSGAVVIVADERVVRVDVAKMGCATPGRPVVFRDSVYVPCRGEGKVIVLSGSGKRAGPDVDTPGTEEPELIADDGRLFINAPGAERGVVVDSDGTKRPVTIRSPELPVVNPDRPPMPNVPTPPRPSPRPEEPDRDSGTGPRAPETPDSTRPGDPPTGGRGKAPGAPPGVTVMLGSRTADELSATVSWGRPVENGGPITGYTVSASGNFTGGSRSTRTTATSVTMTFPCGGSMFCVNGKLTVSVTATNRSGNGAPGTRTWNVPPQGGSTNPPTTSTPAPPPPAPPTNEPPPPPPPPTNEPPPPPPPTNEPPPPPPATVPSAGATVITGSSSPNGPYDGLKRITMSPPGDWASHDGRCELVNITYGYTTTIACSATSGEIYTEMGSNRIVVRAYASDGSRSVDSASRSVLGPREPMCGKYVCMGGNKIVELSPTERTTPVGQVGTGVGLLALAVVLRVVGRREDERP